MDRAGSITVILLLKAGPETTHTEHWQRRKDMFGKTSGVKQLVPGKCQLLSYGVVYGDYTTVGYVFNRDNDRLTVPSPETSGVTATAQFS